MVGGKIKKCKDNLKSILVKIIFIYLAIILHDTLIFFLIFCEIVYNVQISYCDSWNIIFKTCHPIKCVKLKDSVHALTYWLEVGHMCNLLGVRLCIGHSRYTASVCKSWASYICRKWNRSGDGLGVTIRLDNLTYTVWLKEEFSWGTQDRDWKSQPRKTDKVLKEQEPLT